MAGKTYKFPTVLRTVLGTVLHTVLLTFNNRIAEIEQDLLILYQILLFIASTHLFMVDCPYSL